MVLWSGVVRVPIAVKNRKIIGSGDNNCYNNTIRKRSQYREWYVYHFKRKILKSIFSNLW